MDKRRAPATIAPVIPNNKSSEACGCAGTKGAGNCKCTDCKCSSGCCTTAANFASTEGSANFASLEHAASGSCCSPMVNIPGMLPNKRMKTAVNPTAKPAPTTVPNDCNCLNACECLPNCDGGTMCCAPPNQVAAIRKPAPMFEALSYTKNTFKVVKLSDFKGKTPT
jgi:hypothetical protein